ncbi:MAG: hypothetical protein ACI4WM_09235 [Erysipelotrichaceae bacterium]
MKNKNSGDVDIVIFLMFIFVLPILGLFLMADEDTREMGETAMVIGLIFWGLCLMVKLGVI